MPQDSQTSQSSVSRRAALAGATASLAAMAMPHQISAADDAKPDQEYRIKNNRIKQSICSWCFKPLSIEDLCKAAVAIGDQAIELLGPEHFAMLKKY